MWWQRLCSVLVCRHRGGHPCDWPDSRGDRKRVKWDGLRLHGGCKFQIPSCWCVRLFQVKQCITGIATLILTHTDCLCQEQYWKQSHTYAGRGGVGRHFPVNISCFFLHYDPVQAWQKQDKKEVETHWKYEFRALCSYALMGLTVLWKSVKAAWHFFT